jgi:hypothetical protein
MSERGLGRHDFKPRLADHQDGQKIVAKPNYCSTSEYGSKCQIFVSSGATS